MFEGKLILYYQITVTIYIYNLSVIGTTHCIYKIQNFFVFCRPLFTPRIGAAILVTPKKTGQYNSRRHRVYTSGAEIASLQFSAY